MPEPRQGILNSLSILIVDSYDKDRYEIAEELTQLYPDYVLHHVASGRTALEFLASHVVHCVLLELNLKDMSGFEVLHTLVPVPSKPRIAVVVRTRLTHPSLLFVAKQNGAQAAFVKKGTKPEVLHAAVVQAISTVSCREKDWALRSVRFRRTPSNAVIQR